MFLHCHLPSHSDSWERELWWQGGAEASTPMSQQDRALLSLCAQKQGAWHSCRVLSAGDMRMYLSHGWTRGCPGDLGSDREAKEKFCSGTCPLEDSDHLPSEQEVFLAWSRGNVAEGKYSPCSPCFAPLGKGVSHIRCL